MRDPKTNPIPGDEFGKDDGLPDVRVLKVTPQSVRMASIFASGRRLDPFDVPLPDFIRWAAGATVVRPMAGLGGKQGIGQTNDV